MDLTTEKHLTNRRPNAKAKISSVKPMLTLQIQGFDKFF